MAVAPVVFCLFFCTVANGIRTEVMSTLATPGFSLALLLLKRLQTVLLKECCSTLLLQRSTFEQIQLPEQYLHTFLYTFSHCKYQSRFNFLMFSVFQVVFTFMAIRQRNTIQIFGLVIFNASFVAYSAVQAHPRVALSLLTIDH